MAVYSLKTVQTIPVPIREAWDFFSSPANLQRITPENMGFSIVSNHHGSRMYAGQIIEYTVKPVMGMKIYWMTEITHVEPGRYFVDEQRFGPYSLWHHQHHFTDNGSTVEMTDIVHYKIPLGWLGRLANRWFVRKQLQKIFEYRYRAVEKLFGSVPASPFRIEMH